MPLSPYLDDIMWTRKPICTIINGGKVWCKGRDTLLGEKHYLRTKMWNGKQGNSFISVMLFLITKCKSSNIKGLIREIIIQLPTTSSEEVIPPFCVLQKFFFSFFFLLFFGDMIELKIELFFKKELLGKIDL